MVSPRLKHLKKPLKEIADLFHSGTFNVKLEGLGFESRLIQMDGYVVKWF